MYKLTEAPSRELSRQLSLIPYDEPEKRHKIIAEIFGLPEDHNVIIREPFVCNDGSKVHFSGETYINAYCIIENWADVYIGSNVMIGPHCTITTTGHPLNAFERLGGKRIDKEIVIGHQVWIGANCVILPGVHIGEKAVIGAGSVVTHDIPTNVVAFGNPCEIQKSL